MRFLLRVSLIFGFGMLQVFETKENVETQLGDGKR